MDTMREIAVDRSLDPMRIQAETGVDRLLAAARDLMSSADGNDVTVQQLVGRSGLSLQSFYQHFEGKNELLLAVFEESLASTAAYLESAVSTETSVISMAPSHPDDRRNEVLRLLVVIGSHPHEVSAIGIVVMEAAPQGRQALLAIEQMPYAF